MNNSQILNSQSEFKSAKYLQDSQAYIYNTLFENNGQQDIYASNSYINLQNVTFLGTVASSVYAESFSEMVIHDSTFANASSDETLGKALYCYSGSVNINKTLFANLTGLHGGAIYAKSDINTGIDNDQYYIKIENSVFLSNKAMHGGALMLVDSLIVVLSSKAFENNHARRSRLMNYVD